MRLLLVLLVWGTAAAAQDAPPPPAPPPPARADRVFHEDPTVPRDTVAALAAPDSLLDAYRARPEFQYDRPEAEGPSLWERLWQWVYRTVIEPIFENTTDTVQQWTLLLLAVLGLGWVVSRLLRADGGAPFSRRDRTAQAGPLLDVEDIAAVDLRALLDDAAGRGAYREAVRYRYLVLLQRMAEAGAVTWRRDKTNRDYLAEARAAGGPLGRAFAEATRVFDYVWYGERPVTGERYGALLPPFERADEALRARHPASP